MSEPTIGSDAGMRGALDLRDSGVVQELLGRPSRDVLDAADRSSYAGRRILITGAGGSVGSELARQLAAFGPAELTLVDHSEYALFRVEQDLRERVSTAVVAPILADVTRADQIERVVAAKAPDVVFHAAAYKHVSMTERDVVSAVRTNVLGSVYVARASRAVNSRFVLISSDKAANARSVMGATKRIAELAVLAEAGVTTAWRSSASATFLAAAAASSRSWSTASEEGSRSGDRRRSLALLHELVGSRCPRAQGQPSRAHRSDLLA